MAQVTFFTPPEQVLVSEASLYRSRENGVVTAGSGALGAGTPCKGAFDALTPVAAGEEASVTAITLYPIDATNDDVRVAVAVRDCEVNDAYLVLGGLDLAALSTALAKAHVIVREGVLTAAGGTFAADRMTDPAVAESPYGPQGNAVFNPPPGAAPDPDPDPPSGDAALSKTATQTDKPAPATQAKASPTTGGAAKT